MSLPIDRPVSFVLLAGDGPSTRVVYHAIAHLFAKRTVILEQPPSRNRLIRGRARRLGWLRTFEMLAFQLGVVPLLKREGRARNAEIMREYGMCDAPLPKQDVRRVDSVNSTTARQAIKDASPDVVLVNGTRIIGKRTLRLIAKLGAPVVNTHVGITPLYRGVHGGYWALVGQHPERFGVTVHYVDLGIDTGPIIAQATTTPSDTDTFATYPTLQLAAAIPLLREHLPAIARGARPQQPAPEGNSALWYHPTLREYLRGWWMYGVR